MGNIRLKLTAISPIHIGSGEIYEPTNFIMDEGVLYFFRDEDFYLALDEDVFRNFLEKNKNQMDSFIEVHKFVKKNKHIVKEIATGIVAVTDGLQKDYDRLLGKVRQLEGRGRSVDRVFNKFEIQRIQRKQVKTDANIYAQTGYIVGSALKGSISTAYQELMFKKNGKNFLKEKFQAKGRDISNNLFKEFKVSDSMVKKVNTKIGFALNKERFDYDFNNPNANIKLSTFIEVIEPNSEFIVDINHGTLKIEEILKSCTSHYMPIFRSMFLSQVNGKKEYINKYLSNNFYDKYRHFQLKDNQYLLRVGKHSGARSVTIDGMRDIKSKLSGGGKHRKPNRFEYREDETTTWFFGDKSNSNYELLPFGWVVAEITDEDIPEYEAIDGFYALQVKKAKDKVKNQEAREEALKREAEAKAKKEAEERAKLASMTPVQRLVDSYSDVAILINDMKLEKIDDFESIKKELAVEIKKILQKTPKTWDKAKKKALDRKVYIEGLLK